MSETELAEQATVDLSGAPETMLWPHDRHSHRLSLSTRR